jgi:FkbM family methyltransferase
LLLPNADSIKSLVSAVLNRIRPSTLAAAAAARATGYSTTIRDDRNYRFAAFTPLLLWRAQTLLSKEPETIEWIRFFGPDDVFYDIGANVGIYSIFAGVRCRRVFAFEPESQNFAALNRNIQLNSLGAKVLGFPLAISNQRKLDTLRLNTSEAGAALHVFGENVDFKGEIFKPAFEQGCLSVTLDELVMSFGLDFPTMIKIDVDGLEERILQGGLKVLGDRRVRGLLVELNETDKETPEMLALLKGAGWQVSKTSLPISDQGGRYRMKNYIFSRHQG